jgi:coenzyme F420-reducing hydrogenase delta subunit
VEVKRNQNGSLGFKAVFLMMPCSSKVEIPHVLKILSEGADGVQVVGCKSEHCRFLVGEAMEEKRIEHARRLLEEIQMGAERLGMSRGEDLTSEELAGIAEERAKAVKSLGPNVMKKAGVP